MGYFPNNDAGDFYVAKYCSRCANFRDNGSGSEGCAVLDLHFIYNYDECNKPNSFLHFLIPRDGIENKECAMFLAPQSNSEQGEG